MSEDKYINVIAQIDNATTQNVSNMVMGPAGSESSGPEGTSGRYKDVGSKMDSLPFSFQADMSYGVVNLTNKDSRPENFSFGAMAGGDGPERASPGQKIIRGKVKLSEALAANSAGDGTKLYSDPPIEPLANDRFLATLQGGYQSASNTICGHTGPFGSIYDVKRVLRQDLLEQSGLTGQDVAIAIVDTGINKKYLKAKGQLGRIDNLRSWNEPGFPTPGNVNLYLGSNNNTTRHGTMCAFAASILAPDATFLDFPLLYSNTLLSDALRAYNQMRVDYNSPSWPYQGLVINNSWGYYHDSWDEFPPGDPGRFIDNQFHPFALLTRLMADEGVDILFAAGNCGQDCPDPRCQGDTSHSIRGANSYEHILCTAANDVNGNRIGYSSQGPGMIASEKPDISAPSHFLGSEVYGPGTPDSGTSTSCPVTAGAVAAIRTRLNSKQYSNQAVFDAFRNTAFNPMGDSWNADIGHGLAIPLGVASQFGLL